MSDEQASDHSRRFDVRVTAESHFAWLRTRLAVERTMMAYMRTAVALIGFGFERAIGHNWTARVDFSAMALMRKDPNLRVTDGRFYGDTPESRQAGGRLPKDATGLVRNPRIGEILPAKMQEVETRLTFGVNRLF
jgi:hypothetical protein